MNKLRSILVAAMLLASAYANAQDVTKRAQNIFIELGGQGLTFTANYDSRFTDSRDGLGGRIGIGYISDSGDKITTIPLSLNYLLGKGNKFFEIGLGATYLSTTGSSSVLFSENESNVIGTMSFFYRLQPVDSGFSFRAGLSPVFSKDFFIPYYGGLSLGYTF
ncbi:hypothetical protein ACXZ1K_17470 [Pedobacter sp. PWIIR3]